MSEIALAGERPSPAVSERRFFTAMSLAIAAVVFAGFSRTYYVRSAFHSTGLPSLLHLHGALFTMWIALFITQVQLVQRRRIEWHRRLGIAGAVIAAGMVAVVPPVVIGVVRRELRAGGGTEFYELFAITLGDAFLFAACVACGFVLRRRAHLHKRLMLLGTIALLPAAIARIPGAEPLGALGYFGGTDLFIAAALLADRVIWKRIDPRFLAAALVVVASQPVRLLLGEVAWWQAFTRWAIS